MSPLASISSNARHYLRPPTSITLRNTSKGIEISWPQPLDKDARKYIIYRSTLKEDKFMKIAAVSPSTSYIDKQITLDKMYKYAIAVASNEVEGEKSSVYLIKRK